MDIGFPAIFYVLVTEIRRKSAFYQSAIGQCSGLLADNPVLIGSCFETGYYSADRK